jgi:large subunit ribosomal protein L17
MRHKKNTQKFKRTEEERRRLWTDLCSALVKSGKIVTFTTRAKWFRPKFERLITLAKRAGEDKVRAYRAVRPYLSEVDSRKLVEEIAPKFASRPGGYTKQFKLSSDFDSQDKSIVLLSE